MIGSVLDHKGEGESGYGTPISETPDSFIEEKRGFGKTEKPQDYIDGFRKFINDHSNDIAALKILIQRPRDLKRKDLRELQLLLDQNGYTEKNLQTAYAEMTNQKITAKDLNNIINREDGYWWLTYEWTNYRLSGSLVNKRRKDHFENGGNVYGKGTFFPLNKNAGIISDPSDINCSCEVHLLLDPTIIFDCTLISFDQNGEVFPTYGQTDESWYNQRAVISIEYYGLNHSPLIRGRKKIWIKCREIADKTQKRLQSYANNSVNNLFRYKCIEDCYYQLAEMSKCSELYSMVVSLLSKSIPNPKITFG